MSEKRPKHYTVRLYSEVEVTVEAESRLQAMQKAEADAEVNARPQDHRDLWWRATSAEQAVL